MATKVVQVALVAIVLLPSGASGWWPFSTSSSSAEEHPELKEWAQACPQFRVEVPSPDPNYLDSGHNCQDAVSSIAKFVTGIVWGGGGGG